MTEHTLKTTDVYWDAIAAGEKTFEVRRNDRAFQRGDIVILRKTDDLGCAISAGLGQFYELRRRVGWMLTGGQFGIEPGYVVFSLEDPAALAEERP